MMNGMINSSRQFVNGLSPDGAAVALAGIFQASPAQGRAVPLVEGVESERGAWVADLVTDEGRTYRNFTTFIPNEEVDLNAAGSPSIGHGKWVQNGRNVEAHTIKFLVTLNGRMIGFTETCSSGEIDDSGTLFTGRATIKTYDLHGRVVNVRRGRMVARRQG